MKYLPLLFLTISIFCSAQENLQIGNWESHLAFIKSQSITQSTDKVFYGTRYAILVIDKDDRSTQKITKTEGLSNIGVRTIKYHPAQNTLIVIYNDGTIDLIKENGDIVTSFFIKNYSNFVGEKIIYDIHISDDETFLLATNYGISKFNIVNNEFVFTTFTGDLEVYGVCQYQNKIYAAAADGLYSINENNAFIDAFSQWEALGTEQGFPADYTPRAVEVFDNKLYFSAANNLYSYNEADAPILAYTVNSEYLLAQYLAAEGEHLLIGFADSEIERTGLNLKLTAGTNNFQQINDCSYRPLDAVEDQTGEIWFADSFEPFKSYKNGTCNEFTVSSPPSIRNGKLLVNNGELWATSGGISLNTSPLGFGTGFYSLINGKWNVYNGGTYPILAGRTDFNFIAIHPENNDVYAASHFNGLAHYNREEMQMLDYSNSSMTIANGAGDNLTRVSGLAFDSENNLWIINHLGSRPISVMRNDGTWESFVGCGSSALIDIEIDAYDNKWIPIKTQNNAFMVFDDKENRCKRYNSGNSELTSNTVNIITKDLEGKMWVGTDEGIVIFECGDPFSSDCRGSRRIVEVDGVPANLLKDENIRAITVDGANRKWIGTNNGVFLLSSDGRENIAFFNTDNSPLFDNKINDIAIDGDNGRVYIGTDGGIQALRGEATTGKSTHIEKPLVFPNPVRPDYTGKIAIKGLATNADVKITDVNGQLIYQTKALGGQAIWDGNDYTGRRASSGVYLVFSARTSNLNQNNTAVAKIVILN